MSGEAVIDGSSRRVMVVAGAGPSGVEALRRLCDRHDWVLINWFVQNSEQLNGVREAFPASDVYWVRDVVKRRIPRRTPYTEWPIRDVDVVNNLAQFDPILWPVFLRETRTPGGMDQLAEYHEVLTLWHRFFEHTDPGLVIFSKIPAHMHDVVAYLLALDRGIPVLFLMGQFHMPTMWLPSSSFQDPPPRIAARYAELVADPTAEIELDDEWEKFFRRMTGSYEASMYRSFGTKYRVSRKTDRMKPRDTLPWKLYRYVARREPVPKTRLLAREIVMGPARARLRWGYRRRTDQPDYDRQYVFVPLHVQPERTSIPQGGVFGNQLLMIEMLSRSVPEGWTVYVKEHPVQLYDTPGHHRNFRSTRLYDELLRFTNVRLVPALISSRKMIENSQAVAAVTSTACWEAFFLGKPSLVFGHVWFEFCDGVFHTPSLRACQDALAEIASGASVDMRHMRACVRAVQDQGLRKPPSIGTEAHSGLEDADREWEAWLREFDRHVDGEGRVRAL